MKIHFFFALVFTILICSCTCKTESTEGSNIVILKGEVYSTTESEGELVENTMGSVYISEKYGGEEAIAQGEIKNNRVEFRFEYPEFKQYVVSTNLGSWADLLSFYPDNDTIYFSINEETSDKQIRGGRLTNEYINKVKVEILNSDLAREQIVAKYGVPNTTFKDGKLITTNQIAKDKLDSLRAYSLNKFLTELPHEPNLTDLNNFFDKIWIPSAVKNVDPVLIRKKSIYLSEKVGNELYDSIMQNILLNLDANKSIGIGKLYKEITVQDSNDESYNLSDYVKENKYTLLDIWATYCGPCIRKSKNLKPIYDTFHKKGFDVFSVMTDVNTKSEYSKLVSKYGYPWTVYTDLIGNSLVQEKYGVKASGGIQLLLDKDGEIVMHSPTQEELRTFLEEHL